MEGKQKGNCNIFALVTMHFQHDLYYEGDLENTITNIFSLSSATAALEMPGTEKLNSKESVEAFGRQLGQDAEDRFSKFRERVLSTGECVRVCVSA